MTSPSSATMRVGSPPQKAIGAPTSKAIACDELGEHVGEREVEVDECAGAEQVDLDRRCDRPRRIPRLVSTTPFGPSRRTRRVDDQAGVVGRRPCRRDRRARPGRGRRPVAATSSIVERAVDAAVDDDDVLEVGQVAADARPILATWAASSQTITFEPESPTHPLALVRRVRRVDGHDDRPGGADGEVGDGELDRVLARIATRSPTPTPSSTRPRARSRDAVPQLVVGELPPLAVAQEPRCRSRRRSDRRRVAPASPSSARWSRAGSVVTASR